MIMPTITSRHKPIVVDIDTQKHFFLDHGKVAVYNHHQILANIRRIMAWIRMENIPMISTMQIDFGNNRYNNSGITGNGNQKKINYTLRRRCACFEANDSTDLLPTILEHYDQIILQKRCFDPFNEPRVDRILSEFQADEFILIGAPAEGAVKATALGLLNRHRNITILVDAIGSYRKISGEITLRQLWERGAKLTDIRTFLGYPRLLLSGIHHH